jgi:inhibitor of KinA sporulation pathway (predicted exonuclease)
MTPPSHFVVLDFEATCDAGRPPEPQEIIEFPSVLLSATTLEVVDEFQSFVRPVHHPQLTAFCKELTSIQQADVDAAPTFPEVFAAHQAWLAGHGLWPREGEAPAVIVTCGDWDLQRMLPAQLAACAPVIDYVPAPYRRWVNIKQPFKRWHRTPVEAGMAQMLKLLGIELVGTHHRGIDDCRNIASIVRALVAKQQPIGPLNKLSSRNYPALPLTLVHDGEAVGVTLRQRALPSLLGLACDAFRRRITAVTDEAGAPVGEQELHELRPGAVLRVG